MRNAQDRASAKGERNASARRRRRRRVRTVSSSVRACRHHQKDALFGQFALSLLSSLDETVGGKEAFWEGAFAVAIGVFFFFGIFFFSGCKQRKAGVWIESPPTVIVPRFARLSLEARKTSAVFSFFFVATLILFLKAMLLSSSSSKESTT